MVDVKKLTERSPPAVVSLRIASLGEGSINVPYKSCVPSGFHREWSEVRGIFPVVSFLKYTIQTTVPGGLSSTQGGRGAGAVRRKTFIGVELSHDRSEYEHMYVVSPYSILVRAILSCFLIARLAMICLMFESFACRLCCASAMRS